MASINIPMDEDMLLRLEKFSWINWSDVARQEANKRRIFEEFLKTKKLTAEDLEFCDNIDWHPVDELPLKKEFIEKLKTISKGNHKKMTLDELDKIMGIK